MTVWRALEAGSDPVEALRNRYPNIPDADLTRDVASVLAALESAKLVATAG
jgi:hypothetical protein